MMAMNERNKTKVVAQYKQLHMKKQRLDCKGYLDLIWKERGVVLNKKTNTFPSFIFVVY